MAKRGKSDGRLFAIGDIHGCTDELAVMIKALAPRQGDTVVFVGDYVDRGPSAHDVLTQLIELGSGAAETVFLKGNHEDMMLAFLGLPGHYGDSFLFNGGEQTLDSYGVSEARLDRALERIPHRHLDFLKALGTSYFHPPYLFVHAGILPTRQLEEQNVEDLLWIRQEFIFHPHQLDATVVFGHTPMRAVMVDMPFKLGIDTGLVYGGKLTCAEFNEGVLYQVGRGSRQVRTQALDLD